MHHNLWVKNVLQYWWQVEEKFKRDEVKLGEETFPALGLLLEAFQHRPELVEEEDDLAASPGLILHYFVSFNYLRFISPLHFNKMGSNPTLDTTDAVGQPDQGLLTYFVKGMHHCTFAIPRVSLTAPNCDHFVQVSLMVLHFLEEIAKAKKLICKSKAQILKRVLLTKRFFSFGNGI